MDGSHVGDTFLDFVAGVSQRDTLAPYMFRLRTLCTSNIYRSNKRKWLYTKKKEKEARSRRYPAETMTDADYADDLALLANTQPQAESQLEQAAGGIVLYGDANKTEFMCFKQKGTISTLPARPLKFKRRFNIPRQQYLIYWKWCQHTPCESVVCCWQVIDQLKIGSLW